MTSEKEKFIICPDCREQMNNIFNDLFWLIIAGLSAVVFVYMTSPYGGALSVPFNM